MKKKFYLLCAGMFMSIICAGFAGCNEPKNPEQEFNENEIEPVTASGGIDAFFEENLYRIGQCIFSKYHDTLEAEQICLIDSCVMINSIDELPKIGWNGVVLEYPALNFDSHTLVIGLSTAPHSGFHVVSKSLVVEQDVATIDLTLEIRNQDEYHKQVVHSVYFWEMYPKIDAKSINVNVIRK